MPSGNSFLLMGIEDRFGEAAGLEERETQEHGVSRNLKDAGMDVVGEDDALHQHGINRHADHHEEALKAQGKKVADVVIAHLAPLAVGQGGKGDRGDRAGQEDLDHASIQDHRDQDRKQLHRIAHQQGFHADGCQFGDAFILQTGDHGCQNLMDIDIGVAPDQGGSSRDHPLSDIKDCHGDIEGV